jgi:ATP-binding cassette subfamily G (WHITE) protein 2 (PDR)
MIALHSQLSLCLGRGFRRLSNNLAVPISFIIGNAVIAVIIGSVFLDIGATADDMAKRSVLLFFSILVNAFMSGFEVSHISTQPFESAKENRFWPYGRSGR